MPNTDEINFWIAVSIVTYEGLKQPQHLEHGKNPTDLMRRVSAAWGASANYSNWKDRKDRFLWWSQQFKDVIAQLKGSELDVSPETSEYTADGRDDVYNPPPSHNNAFTSTISLRVRAITNQGLDLEVQTVHLLPTEKHAQFVSERLTAMVRLIRHSADMAHLTISEVSQQATPQNMSDEMIQPAEKLTIGFDDKKLKTYARVRGGKFSEWGVPIYPETMLEYGWHFEEMAAGTVIPLSGQMVVQLKGDKPVRVLRLIL